MMKLLIILCVALSFNRVASENLLSEFENKMKAEGQRWENIAGVVKDAMKSIKSRQIGFHEVSFIDCTTKHDPSQLFKIVNDDREFVVNIISKRKMLAGKTPEFVIILQDTFYKVRITHFI